MQIPLLRVVGQHGFLTCTEANRQSGEVSSNSTSQEVLIKNVWYRLRLERVTFCKTQARRRGYNQLSDDFTNKQTHASL